MLYYVVCVRDYNIIIVIIHCLFLKQHSCGIFQPEIIKVRHLTKLVGCEWVVFFVRNGVYLLVQTTC